MLTFFAAVILTCGQTEGQNVATQSRPQVRSEFSSITSTDRVVQVRYPATLLVCKNLDGENPDAWSPEACAAEIPVCDSSGHSGNVLLCLAYPAGEFGGSELQAAAFVVNRIDNLGANECTKKWARTNTKELGQQKINSLNLQAAKAEESAHSHVADQHIYRIYHKGACYELDINIVMALDSAFAAEDVPHKLAPAERDRIRNTLEGALAGFRFLQ